MAQSKGKNKWRGNLYLLWISFLTLFLELSLIRWLGVEISILAYFRNLALISCFIGLGAGFSLKKYKVGLFSSVFLTAILVTAAHPGFRPFGLSLRDVPNYLNVLPDFFLWIQMGGVSPAQLVLGVVGGFLLVAAVVVVLAWIFIPFGQILGAIFESSDNRIRDYSINLLGSLLGVWMFSLFSHLRVPPWGWFLVGIGGALPFIIPRSWRLVAAAFLLAAILFLTMDKPTATTSAHWSPYQKVEIVKKVYAPRESKIKIPYMRLKVNSVYFMHILDISRAQADRHPSLFDREDAPYYPYDLPYRFFQSPPEHALIVGAGAGNDAAAAVRNGARQIDAVEIDPVIAELGKEYHYERPYQNHRVNLIIDDARSFLKKTHKKYDLIAYGLLDSHTLTSNFTNIHLDSYVYTVESLREAKAHLAENGIIALRFQVSRVWIGLKIWKMIKETFEQPPLVLQRTDKNIIHGAEGFLFIVGNEDKIREKIEGDSKLKSIVAENRISEEKLKNYSRDVDFDVPRDDWPYLYLQNRRIPSLNLVMVLIIYIIMRLAVRFLFASGRPGPWHFFFLGAGFMLVETHSISKTALLFGSTWIVNAVIISAILTMLLCANLIALRYKIERLRWWYGGLFLSLAMSYAVPVHDLLVGGYLFRGVIAGIFYSLPMLFAGVIFARSIRRVMGVEGAFAANMLGAAVGGMLESVSYLFGLKAVVLVALALYMASAVFLSRMPLIDSTARG